MMNILAVVHSSSSGSRVQVWVQVEAPAGHLAFTPEGSSRGQSKVLSQLSTAKSMAKLLVQQLGLQTQLAATSLLKKNVLPLLQYWLSSLIKKVLMLCKLGHWGQQRVNSFSYLNETFDGISKKLLPTKAATIALLHLSIIHWSLSRNMT